LLTSHSRDTNIFGFGFGIGVVKFRDVDERSVSGCEIGTQFSNCSPQFSHLCFCSTIVTKNDGVMGAWTALLPDGSEHRLSQAANRLIGQVRRYQGRGVACAKFTSSFRVVLLAFLVPDERPDDLADEQEVDQKSQYHSHIIYDAEDE
jgi:hypothetical protein